MVVLSIFSGIFFYVNNTSFFFFANYFFLFYIFIFHINIVSFIFFYYRKSKPPFCLYIVILWRCLQGTWLTHAGYWFILRFCEHFTCLSSWMQNAIKLEIISSLITSSSSYQCRKSMTWSHWRLVMSMSPAFLVNYIVRHRMTTNYKSQSR
jgi:hypothetical protein